MRVAQLREQRTAGLVEVLFLESPRFYKLLMDNPAYDRILGVLHDALTQGHSVTVETGSLNSDILENVK